MPSVQLIFGDFCFLPRLFYALTTKFRFEQCKTEVEIASSTDVISTPNVTIATHAMSEEDLSLLQNEMSSEQEHNPQSSIELTLTSNIFVHHVNIASSL